MEQKDTIEVFKALADETRLNAVRKLAEIGEPVSSCDVVRSCAKFTQLSQPAMSHHFGKLVDARLITEQKHGTQKVYTLNVELLRSMGIDPTKL